MENKILYDTVESWLDGTLTESDALVFEKKLNEDKELQERVVQHRKARLAVEVLGDNYFREKFAQWDTELDNSPSADNPKFGISFFLVLLGIILIVAIGAYFIYVNVQTAKKEIPNNSSPDTTRQFIPPATLPDGNKVTPNVDSAGIKSNAKTNLLIAMANKELKDLPFLAERHLKEFSDGAEVRGTDNEPINPDFIEGEKAYLKKDYIQAKMYLNKIPRNDAAYFHAQELIAVIFTTQQKYEKAIESYENALEGFSSANYQGQWLLIQLYLLDYDKNKSKVAAKLDELIEYGDDIHRNKAMELKSKILKL